MRVVGVDDDYALHVSARPRDRAPLQHWVRHRQKWEACSITQECLANLIERDGSLSFGLLDVLYLCRVFIDKLIKLIVCSYTRWSSMRIFVRRRRACSSTGPPIARHTVREVGMLHIHAKLAEKGKFYMLPVLVIKVMCR